MMTVPPGQIDTCGECFVNAATWYCAAEAGCGHLFGQQTTFENISPEKVAMFSGKPGANGG